MESKATTDHISIVACKMHAATRWLAGQLHDLGCGEGEILTACNVLGLHHLIADPGEDPQDVAVKMLDRYRNGAREVPGTALAQRLMMEKFGKHPDPLKMVKWLIYSTEVREELRRILEEESGSDASKRTSVVFRGEPWTPIMESDYDEAIQALQVAKTQSPDDEKCNLCHEPGHHAWECDHNPLAMARAAVQAKGWEGNALPWRCFHCGEVFGNETSAARHFGHHSNRKPAACVEMMNQYKEQLAIVTAERDKLAKLSKKRGGKVCSS